MSAFAIDIAVTKFCRPYLLTYVTGSTDYINAVFADVSVCTCAILVCSKLSIYIAIVTC